MCDKKLQYFDVSTLQYTSASKVNIADFCNAITFKNNGNIILLVDFEPLQPGESKSIGGNENEVFYGRHDIAFTIIGLAVVPAIQVPSCWITQKFFITQPPGTKSEVK